MLPRARTATAFLPAALLALACTGSAPAPRRDDAVLRIGWAGSPDSLNPGVGKLSKAYTIFELVYDSMFRLAESASVSPDGKTWTFRLRSGVAFHDGVPLTARDVAFSYRLYAAHAEFPYLHSYTAQFESVEAPDASTVVLRLTRPIPDIESELAFLYVVPEHVWAPHAADAAEFDNAAMVGSGPFRLVEFRRDEFVRLAANTARANRPPRVAGVLFQCFANLDALVQALRTGQVDMITEMPVTAARALRGESGIRLVTPSPVPPRVADIAIDQIAPERCPPGGVCSGHPALRDRTVRLALALATDKRKILDVVLLGLGVPGRTLIPAGLTRWYDADLADHPFDPGEANRLLDGAGYADTDGDGVREMPGGGRPLDFRLYRPTDSPSAPRFSELLSEMWARIGVRTRQQPLDPTALADVRSPAYDYDLVLWSWESDPDPNLLLAAMTGDGIPSGANETGYANPEYDALFARQEVDLDPMHRIELVREMQRIVHRDVVYIVPFYPRAVQAYRTDRFAGWKSDESPGELQTPESLAAIVPLERRPS